MARKFLYLIAAIIFLILIVFLGLRLFPQQAARFAFVPSSEFVAPAALPANAYADAARWYARPDKDKGGEGANWRPDGEKAAVPPGRAAVFFIHPTSLMSRNEWNALSGDKEVDIRATKYVRIMGSAFADSGTLWAPRYRQATLGAFLTDKPAGQQALSAAFADLLAAFDHFIAQQGADTPIILAGHSQGSMHLKRLLKERVAGQPLAQRIVAAYVIGWPVPLTADLPALGLPACRAADETGCILSFQSFAEPAEYAGTMDLFEALPGLTGKSRRGDAYLCTNPVTGTAGGTSDAASHGGMISPGNGFDAGVVVRPGVAARCDAKGFLLIGPGPDLGPFVMPGNNYHAYDYPLFWFNLRADAAKRLSGFAAQ